MSCIAGSSTSRRKVKRNVMENPASFPWLKRVLFPFGSEQPVPLKRGTRVVLLWMLLFPLPLLPIVLLIALIGRFSLQDMLASLLFAFLVSAGLFGFFAAFIVVMSNRAARLRLAWKARNGQS